MVEISITKLVVLFSKLLVAKFIEDRILGKKKFGCYTQYIMLTIYVVFWLQVIYFVVFFYI